MNCCDEELKTGDRGQGPVLVTLLLINLLMFVIELVTGVRAESTGLIADSLDMLSDAAVYGIALYAVGRSTLTKAYAAHLSGIFQMLLAAGVALDVTRRFIAGSDPVSGVMMGIGAVALAANITCLVLISKHREGEVHMRASWIFSRNDVLANLGIIAGGILVGLSGSRLPDLVIGAAITVVVLRGGLRIVGEARAEKEAVLSEQA